MKKNWNPLIFGILMAFLFVIGCSYASAQQKAPEIFSAEWGTYVIKESLPSSKTKTKYIRVKQNPSLLPVSNIPTHVSNDVLRRQVNIFDRNNEMMRAMSIWRQRPREINSNYSQERFEDYLIAFNIQIESN